MISADKLRLKVPPCNSSFDQIDFEKKALVIRFSSIGDLVLTTPVIRCMAQAGYEAQLLTHGRNSSVLASNEHLSVIHSYKGQLWQTTQWIRNQNFDVVLDLHCSLRSHWLRIISFKKFIG